MGAQTPRASPPAYFTLSTRPRHPSHPCRYISLFMDDKLRKGLKVSGWVWLEGRTDAA